MASEIEVGDGAAALGHDQLLVGKANRVGPGSNQVDHIGGSKA
jgi:hypothetical protein